MVAPGRHGLATAGGRTVATHSMAGTATREMRKGAGNVGDICLVDLERLALDVLVHEIEHGPLEHLLWSTLRQVVT